MSIRNASVPVGATYAPTGGTATNLVILNSEAGLVKAFIGTTGVNPLTRTEVEFKASQARSQSGTPGGYTQVRASALLKVPKTLANLNRTNNTAEFKMAFDPESTDAEIAGLKLAMVNFILDTDFDQLWRNASTD